MGRASPSAPRSKFEKAFRSDTIIRVRPLGQNKYDINFFAELPRPLYVRVYGLAGVFANSFSCKSFPELVHLSTGVRRLSSHILFVQVLICIGRGGAGREGAVR